MLQSFLGVGMRKSLLVLDPVMPKSLDGLRAEMELAGAMVEITYRVQERGCGPRGVSLNGADLPFTRSPNPYRTGAVEIPMKAVREGLREGVNRLTVQIG